jgi:hypothetical protein
MGYLLSELKLKIKDSVNWLSFDLAWNFYVEKAPNSLLLIVRMMIMKFYLPST